MSVTECTEKFNRTGTVTNIWTRTYQRTFQVLTDSQFDSVVTVVASLPVQIGNYYLVRDALGNTVEHDYGSFVNQITPRCTEEDGMQWEVTVDYAPYNPSIFPKNPLDWPIKVSWGTAKFQRSVDMDVNGDAILNSAGDYFDPPVEVDDSRTILKIVRSEASFDPSFADTFQDAINLNVFFGQQPGSWKVSNITADLEYNVDAGTSDGFYYTVTYEFEFRAEGWQSMILDQGIHVLSGGVKINAPLAGKDTASPIPLDGHGAALASGHDPVFLTFDVYNSVDFGPLNLDPNGAPGQG